MELNQIYNPLTAAPFACNEYYMEFAPCAALKPYIKCFWGTKKPVRFLKSDVPKQGIVTPDTCMDIVFDVDFTNNKINSGFCGIDDRTFFTCDKQEEERVYLRFAIRFYAWSASLFAEESMRDVRNGFFDAGYHFSKLKKEIGMRLFDVTDIRELITVTERLLWEKLQNVRRNSLVETAVAEILVKKGNLNVGQLSRGVHIGSRQLERVFREYIGVSPKNLASMVRYQYLWNDILHDARFDVLDAVYQYGYTDQAHLFHEFKKFHSMNIADAKKYAWKDVIAAREASNDKQWKSLLLQGSAL